MILLVTLVSNRSAMYVQDFRVTGWEGKRWLIVDRGTIGRLVMGGWKALYSPPAGGITAAGLRVERTVWRNRE